MFSGMSGGMKFMIALIIILVLVGVPALLFYKRKTTERALLMQQQQTQGMFINLFSKPNIWFKFETNLFKSLTVTNLSLRRYGPYHMVQMIWTIRFVHQVCTWASLIMVRPYGLVYILLMVSYSRWYLFSNPGGQGLVTLEISISSVL